MAITEKINTLRTEKEQQDKVIEACGILQKARNDIIEANVKLQSIADSGSFDTVDAEIKSALLAAWNIVKTANNDFANQAMVDLLTGHSTRVCQYCGNALMQEVTLESPELPPE